MAYMDLSITSDPVSSSGEVRLLTCLSLSFLEITCRIAFGQNKLHAVRRTIDQHLTMRKKYESESNML